MADQASTFTIVAKAQGFDKVSQATRRLSADFQMAGRAGQQMGRQVAQGLTQMHRHPHRGSHAPRPGARHPHRHHGMGGMVGAPVGGGGGGGFGGGFGGGAGPPGGPPGGGFAGGGGGYPPARGSFLQGLLQGSTGNIYIPRGPGMLSQTAGLTAGRLGQSVLSSTVSGPEALVGGLASIPGIGPILAGAFGQGISSGRTEIGYQNSMSNLMPYINAEGGSFTERLNSQRDRLSGLGMAYGGMSAGQTLQTLAQAQERAGGLLTDMSDNRLTRILASQKGYGVDAGTGAILARGEDLGAVTGQGADRSESVAIRSAERLGLKGSEIVNYVRNIAGHVQSFAQTGMKVSPEDEGNAGRMFQALGGPTMTGQRAAFMGQGFESTANAIAANGPQDSNQSALLMAAGWNPEDPSSYLQALRNLEDPGKRAQYMAKAEDDIRTANAGMDPLQQAEILRKFRRSNTGVEMTHREADELLTGSRGPRAAQRALATAQTEAVVAGEGAAAAQGAANVPQTAMLGAATENRREKVGEEEAMAVATSEYNSSILATGKSARYVGDQLMAIGNYLSDKGGKIVARAWDALPDMPRIH